MRKQVSDLTSLLRFPGTHLSSWPKIGSFMVSYPRNKFLSACSSFEVKESSLNNMVEKTLHKENLYYQDDLSLIRTFGAVGISRGPGVGGMIKSKVDRWAENNVQDFCNSYFNLLQHQTEVGRKEIENSFTYIHNSANINNIFRRLSDQFSNIVRNRVCLDLYLQNGMDQMEFIEAEYYLNDFKCELIPCLHGMDEFDFDKEEEEENR